MLRIVRPAVAGLSARAGSPPSSGSRLFYIPRSRGVFGLIGGYSRQVGRRRVLPTASYLRRRGVSIGFSTSIEMLLILRCFVFGCVCVEFVAAVAWLAELFPEPSGGRKCSATTQAFSSLGASWSRQSMDCA